MRFGAWRKTYSLEGMRIATTMTWHESKPTSTSRQMVNTSIDELQSDREKT
jgi:hypothetical protein